MSRKRRRPTKARPESKPRYKQETLFPELEAPPKRRPRSRSEAVEEAFRPHRGRSARASTQTPSEEG